jgi:ParB-like chromosome segregation protein Spo0J
VKIEKCKISELVPDPANVRLHNEKNLQAIKGSLARFGQQKPLVCTPEGVIIAGNGTFEAAKMLGWEKIDVIRTSLKGSDLTAFGIADNRTAELAEWDSEALAKTLASLEVEGFILDEIGFEKIEDPISRPDGDKAGVSPWDRVGDAADGVVFSFGSHCCRVEKGIYDKFLVALGHRDVEEWLNEVINP